jgi:hypothetical protein
MAAILALIAYLQFSIGQILFSVGLPFCFFVNFTIYVIGVDQPWVALMAKYHIPLDLI